jgi:hypothetical protein
VENGTVFHYSMHAVVSLPHASQIRLCLLFFIL